MQAPHAPEPGLAEIHPYTSRLPRRQQDRIVETVSAPVVQYTRGA